MPRSYFLGNLRAIILQLCSKKEFFACISKGSIFDIAGQFFYFLFSIFPEIFKISKQLFWILVLYFTCKLQQHLVYLLEVLNMYGNTIRKWVHQGPLKLSGLWWSLTNMFSQLFSNCQSQKLVLQNIYRKPKSLHLLNI